MNLLRQIKDNQIIKVELISILSDQPLVIAPQEGNISLNQIADAKFNETYFTVNSAYLEETGKDTDAGYQYLQEFGFKIPTNKDRVAFLKYFKFLRLIKFIHNDGTSVEMGRNDIEQNVPMKASFSTDLNFTSVKWSVQAIFPFDYKI